MLFTAGALVYIAATGLAFVNAYAFLAVQAALAVYYALDPLSWRAGRDQTHGNQPEEHAPEAGSCHDENS